MSTVGQGGVQTEADKGKAG